MRVRTSRTAGRLFAVGDIHGCARELKILLDYIIVKLRLSKNDRVVFLGDYIDRGKESNTVIASLLDFKSNYPETVFLRGNHEDMFLNYLGYDGRLGDAFLVNGGADTLASYHIPITTEPNRIIQLLPKEHLDFFLNLDSLLIENNHIIVHAGLDPLRAIDTQIENDLYWIREDFISAPHQFDKTVVFGHTPQMQILVDLPYKLGIDTGLCFGNLLTCINLTDLEVHQLRKGKNRVKKQKLEKLIEV